MIPGIGTIIAAYVGFRIIEIIAQSRTRYPSDGARLTVVTLGILALLVIGFGWADLIFSGMSASTTLTH